jgi:hypothetical protein
MQRTTLAVCLCLSITGIASSSSTVQYLGTYGQTTTLAGTWYTGQVSAGIYHIQVNGVTQDSFCIDLHDSATSSPVAYDVTSVAGAPDPALGPMGEQKAAAISKLWAMAYSPTMTESQAAALQLAIWDCVVDLDYSVTAGNFRVTGSTYGAQTLLDSLQTYTGSSASLYALTNTQYQDFVTAVPAPGALTLGSLGLMVVGWFRARRRI